MHRSIPRSLEKAQRPARIDSQQFWTKKAKPVPVFNPGLLRQNATVLPLVPSTRPIDPPELLAPNKAKWSIGKMQLLINIQWSYGYQNRFLVKRSWVPFLLPSNLPTCCSKICLMSGLSKNGGKIIVQLNQHLMCLRARNDSKLHCRKFL